MRISEESKFSSIFKKILSNRETVIIFISTAFSIFLALSLWTLYKEKAQRDFSISLDRFKSDIFQQTERRALFEDRIYKKHRFIAFGSYETVPVGIYRAIFYLESESPKQPASLEFQIAAERGKKVVTGYSIRLDNFPVLKEIKFKVHEEKEIEPRILYSSGNHRIRLRKVTIQRLKGIFPWQNIVSQALFYAIFSSLILLSVIHTFKSSTRWKFFLTFFFFLVGFYLIIQRAWVSEDAFISLRHIENLLGGHGPVFNTGERVEGFTHPLWFAVISLFRWLGFSPKGAVILPGLIFSFTALYILFFKIRLSSRENYAPLLNPGAAILIGTSAFIDFGTSGLETSLSFMLIILYAKFIAEDKLKSCPLLTGLIVALLTLTRPDFGLFFVFLLCFYIYELIKKRIPFKRVIYFLAMPILLVGGYQLFRMGYYAALLPNPFYAKSGAASHFSQGFNYLFDFFQGSLSVVILFLALLTILLNFRQKELKSRLLILLSGLVHGFFVIRGGGDFMHGRFLLPAFILITVSITGAFDRFLERKAAMKNGFIAVCLIIFYLSFNTLPVQKRGKIYNYGISDERYAYYKNKILPLKYLFKDTVIIMWKTIGMNYRDLSERANLKVRIAYLNVGFIGFYSGKHVYLVDRLGLADPVVSRIAIQERGRPGHEKHTPFGYLILRKLTFGDTPFPLWNQIASTKFGVIWDLSPKTLRKLKFTLGEDFKKDLDIQVVNFLASIDEAELKTQSDLLFFLKHFWLPYASQKEQKLFREVYRKDIISQHSSSFRWIKENRDQVLLIDSHIKGPMNRKRFFRNTVFSLSQGLSIKF